jgi:hypothetical protein
MRINRQEGKRYNSFLISVGHAEECGDLTIADLDKANGTWQINQDFLKRVNGNIKYLSPIYRSEFKNGEIKSLTWKETRYYNGNNEIACVYKIEAESTDLQPLSALITYYSNNQATANDLNNISNWQNESSPNTCCSSREDCTWNPTATSSAGH